MNESETNEFETVTDLEAWVGLNWSPTMPAGKWWAKLAEAGYSSAILPLGLGGRNWSRAMAQEVTRTLARLGVLGPPLGPGLTLVAPTLMSYGTPEQIERWVPSIAAGRHAWCQLFSEPGAGSDLAGLATVAEKDELGWTITGTKTWTSGADIADMGFLLARTDTTASKHAGISAFVIDMSQPEIHVESLRQMTGRTGFSTVHFDGARVELGSRIGEDGAGWAVAKAMLAEERASYRAAGSGGLVTAKPGTVANDLETSVGSILDRYSRPPRNVIAASEVEKLIALAREFDVNTDPITRQELVRLALYVRLSGMIEKRPPFPGQANVAKLLISETFRLARSTGSHIAGPATTVVGNESVTSGWLQEMILFSPGPPIYGGTDEIQKNILAERTLGLPR